jgi:hypothetical protein
MNELWINKREVAWLIILIGFTIWFAFFISEEITLNHECQSKGGIREHNVCIKVETIPLSN